MLFAPPDLLGRWKGGRDKVCEGQVVSPGGGEPKQGQLTSGAPSDTYMIEIVWLKCVFLKTRSTGAKVR